MIGLFHHAAIAQNIVTLSVSGEAHQTGVDINGNFLDIIDNTGQIDIPSSLAYVDTTGGFGGVSSVQQQQGSEFDNLGIEQLVYFESSVSSTFGELAHGDSSMYARFQTSEEVTVNVSIVCSDEGIVDIAQVPVFGPIRWIDLQIQTVLLDSLFVDCDGRLLRDYIDEGGDATFTASGEIVLPTYTDNAVENLYDLELNAQSDRFECKSSMSSIHIDFVPQTPVGGMLSDCDLKLVSRLDQLPSTGFAIDGDTILIGDPTADFNGVVDSGALHEYRLINSYWTLVETFQHPDAQSGDSLGVSIELLGDTAAVRSTTGSIYIFDRVVSGEWEWVDTIPLPDIAVNIQYARDMELSTNIDGLGRRGLIVSDTWGRRAYIFVERLGIWVFTHTIDEGDLHGFSNYSKAVEIYQDLLIISAPSERISSEDASCDDYLLDGSLYIYQRDGIGWMPGSTLVDPAAGIAGWFGDLVEVDDDVMAVSSPYAMANFNGSKGSVLIYRHDGSQWVPIQKLSSPTAACDESGWPPGFGWHMRVSGENLIVGDYDQSEFFWYKHDGVEWVSRGRLPILLKDQDSVEMKLSGDTLALRIDGIWNLYALEPGPDGPVGLPTLISTYTTPDLAREVMVIGTTAYIADGGSGLQILDVSNLDSPFLLGSYDSPGFSQDVAVVGSTAYVADGVDGGLLVLDVSDPSSPRFISSYNTPGNAINVTVVGDLVYVADNGGGLLIFDMATPSNPILLGSYGVPDSARSVEVIGTTAYLAAGPTGLIMLDVGDPTNPLLLGEYDSPGYAQFIDVQGTTGYLADWTSGLRVLNLSDPHNLTEIAYLQTENAGTIVIEGTTAYLADGGAGLKIIDISDPSLPSLLASYDTPNFALDVFIDGETAFVADNSAGLQIIALDSCNANDVCPADLNSDGNLDFFDISAFLVAFSQQDAIADMNSDGILDFFDISAFLQAFSAGCP